MYKLFSLQRLVRAVAVPGAESDERSVLVLSANSLQKWYLIPNEPDKLVYECNVEKYIREGFVDHVWVSVIFMGNFQNWIVHMVLKIYAEIKGHGYLLKTMSLCL